MGGPDPPITALISAPVVLIRSLRKLAGKNFMHGDGVPEAGVQTGSWANERLCNRAAAPAASAAFCSNSRRLPNIIISSKLNRQRIELQRTRAVSQLFNRHTGAIENRNQQIR